MSARIGARARGLVWGWGLMLAACGGSGSHGEPGVQAKPGPAPEADRTGTGTSTGTDADTDAPTPEEIDALLADPRLHSGRIPDDMRLPSAGKPDDSATQARPPEPPNPQRQALGTKVLEALASKDAEAGDAVIVGLTPLGEGPVRAACPGHRVNARALRARLAHCREAFTWDDIEAATVNGGQATERVPAGCEDDVRALERVRVQVKTKTARFDAELRDPVGRDGEILGFLGTLTCVDRTTE